MSDMSDTPRLDMERLRRSLAGRTGTSYWRSLEELAGTPEFREFLHREFPAGAAEWDDPAGRRQFLKIMGASLALAGLAGCTRQPAEAIVPYVRQPEEVVPGKPLYYATALTLGGHATGVLVESHLGRPTKIEGNPEHPASLGATDALTQAAVLNLYDPDRAQTVTRLGEIQPYGEFLRRSSRPWTPSASRGAPACGSSPATSPPPPWRASCAPCWPRCRRRAGTSTSRRGSTAPGPAPAWPWDGT